MKDQISALMDDELAPDATEHLITSVKTGGESAECWAIYHLIGDTMRGNPIFRADFHLRLMQLLDAEPTALAPKGLFNKSLVKTPIVWSVAASVAAVAFVGWTVLQQQVQNGNDATPIEIAQNLPSEYLLAHQASAPSGAAYYIQPATYTEGGE